MSPQQRLAELILAFDEDNPGDPEAEVIVPFDVWAEMVDLAGKIGPEENED